jgi:hypothetical protein
MTQICTDVENEDIEFHWILNDGAIGLRGYPHLPMFEHALEPGADPRRAMEIVVEKCVAHLRMFERHLLASCEEVYPAVRELSKRTR